MWRRSILFIAMGLLLGAAAPLTDKQEQRAQALFYELRCMVCQGESVAESQAEVAADIRRVVREHIAAGHSNETIKQQLVTVYGQRVLMHPRFEPATYLLWMMPFILASLSAAIIFAYFFAARMGKRS